MPDIVGPHNGSQVFTPVILLPVERFDRISSDLLSLPLKFQILSALIDTGAQGTCLTANAARKLDLDPSGIVPIQGVGGTSFHNVYIFKVGFVDLRKDELGNEVPTFHLVEREIEGAEFDCGPMADFDVLLGMDVLSIGTLTVSNNRNFRFTF